MSTPEGNSNEPLVYLQTSDGGKITVAKKLIQQCGLFRDIFEMMHGQKNDANEPIPLPNVTLAVMKQVIAFSKIISKKESPEPLLTPLVNQALFEAARARSAAPGKSSSRNTAQSSRGPSGVSSRSSDSRSRANPSSASNSPPTINIFDLVLAANYLMYDELRDPCCAIIARQMKNRGPEEIRQLWNIENDFTAEEQAEIEKEQRWAMST